MESIAYCPEKNTIWCDLTVEEELRLYAILNGTPIKYADQVVDKKRLPDPLPCLRLKKRRGSLRKSCKYDAQPSGVSRLHFCFIAKYY
ncbi:hypothetical protein AVEN_41549-1 [Araneus ventricosus]|uniref:Uncharacterized protein n=1 Tax=Araneus ventricosus TaxID=182803 RepID=A0A4Y2UXR8_ARAVE|nr:hypothetical protein AVEN_41549-1 [Araneus ventricosus]